MKNVSVVELGTLSIIHCILISAGLLVNTFWEFQQQSLYYTEFLNHSTQKNKLMDQQQMLMMLPGIQPNELHLIQSLTNEMTETQQQQFYSLYSGKRKEQQTLLIMTLIGFLGISGIQRFVIGETGLKSFIY